MLSMFCDRDLEINPMTLKLEGYLYIKMWKYIPRSTVKISKSPNYFKHYRNRYADQTPAIFDR